MCIYGVYASGHGFLIQKLVAACFYIHGFDISSDVRFYFDVGHDAFYLAVILLGIVTVLYTGSTLSDTAPHWAVPTAANGGARHLSAVRRR